jgi:general secretion pathway protein G
MKIFKRICIALICFFALIGIASVFLLPTISMHGSYTECYKSAADLNALKTAVKLFKKDMERLPTSEEGLSVLVFSDEKKTVAGYKKHGYIEELSNDPWGYPYQYVLINNGSSAIIRSTGSPESCFGINFSTEIKLSHADELTK